MLTFKDVLEYRLFSIGGTPIDLSTLLVALVITLIGFWMARTSERMLVRFLSTRNIPPGSAGVTGRLTHHVILTVSIAVAVHTLGINLTALFTAGAVLAIAIGFAMQNIAQNFVSGIILLFERTVKPGDVIEVEGHFAKVERVGLRATVARTWDSEEYIVPNSILVTTTFKNFTLTDELYRLRAAVGVTYGSDMQQVREVLERTATAIDWRVQSKDPVIFLKEFGSSSVDWEVSIWIDDPFVRSAGLSRLYEAIWFALKEAGITIAFPQLDVHFDDDANLPLSASTSRSPHA